MPVFNADALEFPEIKTTLGGKEYTVREITQSDFEALGEGGADASSLRQQFCRLTGADESQLDQVPVRKLGAALRWIQETIGSQIKDASKAKN